MLEIIMFFILIGITFILYINLKKIYSNFGKMDRNFFKISAMIDFLNEECKQLKEKIND